MGVSKKGWVRVKSPSTPYHIIFPFFFLHLYVFECQTCLAREAGDFFGVEQLLFLFLSCIVLWMHWPHRVKIAITVGVEGGGRIDILETTLTISDKLMILSLSLSPASTSILPPNPTTSSLFKILMIEYVPKCNS